MIGTAFCHSGAGFAASSTISRPTRAATISSFAISNVFQFNRKKRIVHVADPDYFVDMTTNAILNFAETVDMARVNPTQQWQAVVDRDATQDGKFFFAVSSTGVYCRPSCPARRPRRENVTFFIKTDEAEKAGYRACLRCRPKAVGNAQS